MADVEKPYFDNMTLFGCTRMTRRILVRTFLTLATLVAAMAIAPATRAEPLLSQGVGTSNCARLAADLKPNEGLNDPVNLMLYAWVQGYISAANVALLEYDSKHVDMAELTDSHVLSMIQDYCKSHPDKKPANALDAYLKTTKKMKAQWQTGTVEWDE
jgi:hypothetical protein